MEKKLLGILKSYYSVYTLDAEHRFNDLKEFELNLAQTFKNDNAINPLFTSYRGKKLNGSDKELICVDIILENFLIYFIDLLQDFEKQILFPNIDDDSNIFIKIFLFPNQTIDELFDFFVLIRESEVFKKLMSLDNDFFEKIIN